MWDEVCEFMNTRAYQSLSQSVLGVVTLIRLEAYKAYYAPLKQYAHQLTICRNDRRKSIVWTKHPTTQKLKN